MPTRKWSPNGKPERGKEGASEAEGWGWAHAQRFYLDVGCEEGELQRPSELHARGDHAGEHELGPGGDGAPRLARPVGVPVRVLGRPLPSARAAVEADELHLGVAEVAVGHVDGRGPAAAPGAGVHGGRQICGQGVGLRVARGEICGSATRQWSEESEQGKGLSPSDQSPDGQGRKEPRSKKMRRARELEGAPTPGPVDCPARPRRPHRLPDSWVLADAD